MEYDLKIMMSTKIISQEMKMTTTSLATGKYLPEKSKRRFEKRKVPSFCAWCKWSTCIFRSLVVSPSSLTCSSTIDGLHMPS
eukprot:18016_2